MYVTLELENGIAADEVKWSSSDTSVATVYTGNVTALGRFALNTTVQLPSVSFAATFESA